MKTLLDAMTDPRLFGPWFARPSWEAWRAFLAALFALPASDAQAAVARAHTGRSVFPDTPAREAYVIAGRRSGKSLIAALIAVWLAAFRDYGPVLAPGEVATVMLLAADRRQARVLLRYVLALFTQVPDLAPLLGRQTREGVALRSGVVIEIHTASFRTTRGYTVAAAILDEVAFWPTEDAANPDTEIIGALRPALATIPGSLLLAISSPYARRGALWDAYRAHYGQAGAGRPLVWQAPSRVMNPTLDPAVIQAALDADEAAARAEWLGEFRRDLEAFVSRETIEACVVPGLTARPPVLGVWYTAWVDPSGGSVDSMTLAIAHAEGGRAVLDRVVERRPPFAPDEVVREFAEVLRAYRVDTVTGDRYGGEWPRERFRAHGIGYAVAERTTSEVYRELLPGLTSGTVELLDVPRLLAQLGGLERRTARGGRDLITHGPAGHDDVANAAAGALLAAAGGDDLDSGLTLTGYPGRLFEGEPTRRELEQGAPFDGAGAAAWRRARAGTR